MRPLMPCLAAFAILTLAACGRSAPPASDAAAPAPAAAPSAAPAAFVDEELERLKATTPLDACAFVTPERLKAVLPELEFEVREHVEPHLSGYSWVSRCVHHAGRGAIAMAPNDPTHSVEVFVTTAASPEKAAERLATRHDGATTTTGFAPQPALGANAFSTSTTGVVMLYFVRDQSEVQINYADLTTPSEEKTRIVLALAGSP